MSDTKQRLMSASAELFRRQGYTGTGLKQIVSEAGAPLGSLYHFFPGGKQQLGGDVIRWAGAQYLGLIDLCYDPEPDPAIATRNAFLGAAKTLAATDYADACPIATIALEVASTNEPLRAATAEVFESWITGLAQRFVAAGIEPAAARNLTISVLSLLEGAFIFSRAARSTEPLAAAGATAAAAVRAALPEKEF